MSKKLLLTDFRAVRSKLEPHDFAISEGQDVPPSDLISKNVWDGIMHLPEDVSLRISDHNGTRLRLMYNLWGDWIKAIGEPNRPDEIYNCLLDAADCFQCANFNFLHGFYRAAIAELRTAFELVLIGTYGSLNPDNEDYISWKSGKSDLNFGRCRKRLSGSLRKEQIKWIFGDRDLLATTYQTLCNYTHSRPDASDGALWQSNGPVYNSQAIKLTFLTTLSVYALSYLLIRLARPNFTMPEDSSILFELDWMPDHQTLVRAFSDLYGYTPPQQPTD
ncbi:MULTISPECIES: hypothetical protein [Burkholderia]|uniref:Uncharacterized protein n=1 Tax=Burkholderia paludis TaxID=1506587 RepID=A0A6P2SQM9_9BURK|nr:MULTISPECIES: hypothetical protein [Burkholderia]CAB3773915.1 hypothetical protein LMG30113_07361 [Burkholderia paludis]VWC47402.1 hypothetical protein BPA30113_07426 [Burkholderia paludis]